MRPSYRSLSHCQNNFLKSMTVTILCVTFLALALILQQQLTSESHTVINNASYNFIYRVEKCGYKAEWHNVTTPDGYILSLFRIPPNSTAANKLKNNSTIFLQHGLAGAADGFVLFGPNVSLALILSDAGYDVWLGNFRGNTHSRRHRELSPGDPKFWDFAIDELAIKDLPTMIDYALEHSNSSSMSFVGFSLSTASIICLLSEKTEYNDKLTSVTLLAPVLKWKKVTAVRTFIASVARVVKWLYPTGAFEFGSQNSIISLVYNNICVMNGVLLKLCYFPFEVMMGSIAPFDVNNMKIWTTQFFSGGSVKTLFQYLQTYDAGSLMRYNYDTPQMNLEKYGQEEPPVYNFSNVRAPIVIFRGDSDPLSLDDDVRRCVPLFKNSKKIIYEPIEDVTFSHLDFLISEKGKKLVYDKLLTVLGEFHGNK